MIASLAAVVLLAAGLVAAVVFQSGPLCPCGCGRSPQQHSPLRRF